MDEGFYMIINQNTHLRSNNLALEKRSGSNILPKQDYGKTSPCLKSQDTLQLSFKGGRFIEESAIEKLAQNFSEKLVDLVKQDKKLNLSYAQNIANVILLRATSDNKDAQIKIFDKSKLKRSDFSSIYDYEAYRNGSAAAITWRNHSLGKSKICIAVDPGNEKRAIDCLSHEFTHALQNNTEKMHKTENLAGKLNRFLFDNNYDQKFIDFENSMYFDFWHKKLCNEPVIESCLKDLHDKKYPNFREFLKSTPAISQETKEKYNDLLKDLDKLTYKKPYVRELFIRRAQMEAQAYKAGFDTIRKYENNDKLTTSDIIPLLYEDIVDYMKSRQK